MATERIIVNYPNLPEGGGAYIAAGEGTVEFARLTLFLRDLEFAEEWAARAAQSNARNDREAFLIGALFRLCRCFESTAGLRQQPLKISKVFVPADRAIFKRLVHIRNKFVAHDVQTHPMQSVVLLFDSTGTAIDAMAVGAEVGLQEFSNGADIPRLIDIALSYVRENHIRVAEELKAEWNALPPEERQSRVPGENKIEIKLRREGEDDQTPAGAGSTVEQEYWIPERPPADQG